jgi:hypothetical protein
VYDVRVRGALHALLIASACGRAGFDPIAPDEAGPPARDAPSPDSRPLPEVCPPDARLLACYGFDGDANDRSPGGTNHGTPSDVTFVPGVDGLAVHTTATSRIDVLSPAFALNRFTIDVWLRPDADTDRQIVFDHDSRWAMLFDPGGIPACNLAPNPLVLSASVTAPLATWAHVACTFDGTTMTVHVSGMPAGSEPGDPVAPGTFPVAIAGNAPPSDTPAPFLGTLDRLRIWNDVLTPQELCAAAGC